MSKAHFPSMVEGKKKSYFGGGMAEGEDWRFNQMKGIENVRGNFHKAQMTDAKNTVINKIRDQRTDELYYLNGGVMGVIPKPQPQGSFSMPLNLNGNTNYGSNGLSGKGGTFQTQEGERYGIQLLKRRAQQLNQLEAIKSGMPLPADKEELRRGVEEVPITPEEEKQLNKLETEITDLESKFNAGDIQEVKTKSVSAIYNKLSSDLGQKLSRDRLDKYSTIVNLATAEIYAVLTVLKMGVRDDREPAEYKRLFSLFLPLYKLNEIINCLIVSKNLQPRERSLYMRGCRNNMDRMKGSDLRDIVKRGETAPLFRPPTPQQSQPSSAPPSASSSASSSIPSMVGDVEQEQVRFIQDRQQELMDIEEALQDEELGAAEMGELEQRRREIKDEMRRGIRKIKGSGYFDDPIRKGRGQRRPNVDEGVVSGAQRDQRREERIAERWLPQTEREMVVADRGIDQRKRRGQRYFDDMLEEM